MRQSELDKLLSRALRSSASAHDWKFSRGFVFRATDLLFFSIIIVGRAKQRILSYSLTYKMLAFDDLFWKIVKLEENTRQPLSFRAFGAWTAPASVIMDGVIELEQWHEDSVLDKLNGIIVRADAEVAKIEREIRTYDENLVVIERLYSYLIEKYPNAVTNIWVERVLTSLLTRDYLKSEAIIEDRIKCGDPGGFQVGSRSFYDLAHEYQQTISGSARHPA